MLLKLEKYLENSKMYLKNSFKVKFVKERKIKASFKKLAWTEIHFLFMNLRFGTTGKNDITYSVYFSGGLEGTFLLKRNIFSPGNNYTYTLNNFISIYTGLPTPKISDNPPKHSLE